MQSPGTPDIEQEGGYAGPRGRAQESPPGAFVVACRDRLAIAPAHVVPQVKDIRTAVVEYVPAVGNIRQDRPIRVDTYEAAEDVGHSHRQVSGAAWVQGRWLDTTQPQRVGGQMGVILPALLDRVVAVP